MFTRRHIKHSRLLLRHARKYLRYKDDQLSASDREQIVAGMKSLREALRQKDRERIHGTADALDKMLHRLTPVTWESHWRENCEVILVAIVVAVGIRSYFLQPFLDATDVKWNRRSSQYRTGAEHSATDRRVYCFGSQLHQRGLA